MFITAGMSLGPNPSYTVTIIMLMMITTTTMANVCAVSLSKSAEGELLRDDGFEL